MSKLKLDREEKVIIDSFNNGDWKSIKDKKSIAKLKTAARKTIDKKKSLNS